MKYIFGGVAILAAQEVFAGPTVVERSSDLPVSENTASLARTIGITPSSQVLRDTLFASSIPLTNLSNVAYAVNVDLGGATFPLFFDTASSDLWVTQTNYKCIGAKGKRLPASSCDIGPTFSGKYTGGQIKGKKFYISYGDAAAYGSVGYESVTVAGVNVAKQEISSAIKVFFPGGTGGGSGVIGFAYDSLTDQYPGRPGTKGNLSQDEPYKNFFSNAIDQKKVAPIFTVVLERGNGNSSLTLGGVPSAYSGLSYVTVPIQKKDIRTNNGALPGSTTKYTYYTLTPQGTSLDGVMNRSSVPYIIDAGNPFSLIPPDQAKALAAAFKPPATLNSDDAYVVPCSAKVPKFAFEIGGKSFPINSRDLFIPLNATSDVCFVGIQSVASSFEDGGPTRYGSLGDTFLNNAVAVFDRGNEELRFAQHTY